MIKRTALSLLLASALFATPLQAQEGSYLRLSVPHLAPFSAPTDEGEGQGAVTLTGRRDAPINHVITPTRALTAPVAWSYRGSLPAGISVGAGGVITGTPSVGGSFPGITVVATGADGQTWDSDLITLDLASVELVYDAEVVARVGRSINLQAAVRNTIGATTFDYTGTLPPGVVVEPSTGGIVGTPTAAGRYVAYVTVTEAYNTYTSNQINFDIEVAPAPSISGIPDSWRVRADDAISVTPTVEEGLGSYTWTATWLPPGVSINATTGAITGSALNFGLAVHPTTGAITGNMVAAGAQRNSVITARHVGSNATVSKSFQFIGANPFVVNYGWSAQPSLSAGTRMTAPFAPNVQGMGVVTFDVVDGALPPGLTLSAAGGAIDGTPTTSGTYAFTVRAIDSWDGRAINTRLTMTVVSPTVPFAIVASGDVKYAGRVDYDPIKKRTFSISGNPVGVVTWALAGGALPPGVSVDAATGAIVGRPSYPHSSASVRLAATDAAGNIAITPPFVYEAIDALAWYWFGSGQYTHLHERYYPNEKFIPRNVYAGFTAQSMNRTGAFAIDLNRAIGATNNPAIVLTRISGSLPPGMAISFESIVGTPTVAGTWTARIRGVDAVDGQSYERDITITVQ